MKRAFSRKNLWDRAPHGIRAVVGAALGRVPPQYLLGPQFRRHVRFVKETDRWPAARSREYQLARLRQLCGLAVAASPFYRDGFRKAAVDPAALRSPEDLRSLPTINRDTVIRYLDDMTVKSTRSSSVDAMSTGGTSGVPLHFYIGAERSAIEYSYLVTSWARAGYRLGIPLAVFRGRTVTPERSGLRHEYDPLLRMHYYSVFHMNDETIQRYMDHLEGIGSCFLHVYPSSATAIAQVLRRSGRPAPRNILGVLSESEIVYPEQRRLIEETFGVRCFSSYGQTEKVVAAAACEASDLYHVWPTYGWFELLDADGRAVTEPGARGEVVGTSFINEVVPFIRYRTGDHATWVGDTCPACGREHPVISDIRGHRIQESLVATDGSTIPWTAINMHDETFKSVRQFQFRQETAGRARLLVVPVGPFGDVEARAIHQGLRNKLAGRLEFDIEVVDSIPLSSRGKAIYVDQRIPGFESGEVTSPAARLAG
jgi:phenylacetate-CoA ligase